MSTKLFVGNLDFKVTENALTVGDRVKMEMSLYDLDKARIVWRLK